MYSTQITTEASKNMPKVKKVTYKKFRLPWVKPVKSQQNLSYFSDFEQVFVH